MPDDLGLHLSPLIRNEPRDRVPRTVCLLCSLTVVLAGSCLTQTGPSGRCGGHGGALKLGFIA